MERALADACGAGDYHSMYLYLTIVYRFIIVISYIFTPA